MSVNPFGLRQSLEDSGNIYLCKNIYSHIKKRETERAKQSL